MTLESELQRLAEQEVPQTPPEGVWIEWSPMPFGRPPEDQSDEPLAFGSEQPG